MKQKSYILEISNKNVRFLSRISDIFSFFFYISGVIFLMKSCILHFQQMLYNEYFSESLKILQKKFQKHNFNDCIILHFMEVS